MPVPKSMINKYGRKRAEKIFYANENKRKKKEKKTFNSQMNKVHKIMKGY